MQAELYLTDVSTKAAATAERLILMDLGRLQKIVGTRGRSRSMEDYDGVAYDPVDLGPLWDAPPDPEVPDARTFGDQSPHSWVLVAGLGDAELTPEVLRVSSCLGALLGAAGFGLVTGGWPGVDTAAAREFIRHLEIDGLRPEKRLRTIMESGRVPAYSGGETEVAASGEDAVMRSVEAASVVILVSGRAGTLWVGKTALAAGKLVLPLAATGGSAKQFYTEARKATEKGPWPLGTKEFDTALRGTWQEALLRLAPMLALALVESPAGPIHSA